MAQPQTISKSEPGVKVLVLSVHPEANPATVPVVGVIFRTRLSQLVCGCRVCLPPPAGISTVAGAKEQGTKIWFKPDAQIFTETAFDYPTIAGRLRELSFLNKGVSITLTDERQQPAKTETFLAKGGLKEMVQYLNAKLKPMFAVSTSKERCGPIDGDTQDREVPIRVRDTGVAAHRL